MTAVRFYQHERGLHLTTIHYITPMCKLQYFYKILKGAPKQKKSGGQRPPERYYLFSLEAGEQELIVALHYSSYGDTDHAVLDLAKKHNLIY